MSEKKSREQRTDTDFFKRVEETQRQTLQRYQETVLSYLVQTNIDEENARDIGDGMNHSLVFLTASPDKQCEMYHEFLEKGRDYKEENVRYWCDHKSDVTTCLRALVSIIKGFDPSCVDEEARIAQCYTVYVLTNLLRLACVSFKLMNIEFHNIFLS